MLQVKPHTHPSTLLLRPIALIVLLTDSAPTARLAMAAAPIELPAASPSAEG
jgi:hypothetical protein